jgi:ankyrin repeat protein
MHVLPVLLKYGLQLNAMDDSGMTPLHTLASEGKADLFCKELILMGADPNIPTRDRRDTVLHIAVSKPDENLLRQILTSQVKLDFNAKNRNDCTALYLAAINNNYDACSLLLEHIADPNVRCEASEYHPKGFTALHKASYYGYCRIVKLLIDAGARTEIIVDGSTALYAAASQGHLDVCRALVSAGANVSFKRGSDDSVISVARRNEHARVRSYLTGIAAARRGHTQPPGLTTWVSQQGQGKGQ